MVAVAKPTPMSLVQFQQILVARLAADQGESEPDPPELGSILPLGVLAVGAVTALVLLSARARARRSARE